MSVRAIHQALACDSGRPRAILAAAERAFARHGFHAATMQHVAVEAGMSPGNLYRYFRSKDAIVEGLCERDQEELAGDFVSLAATDDVVAGIEALLRRRLIEKPRENLGLIVEIWAEAGRNPAIAAIQRKIDALVEERLAATFEAAKRRGATAPDLDVDFVVRGTMMIGAGLFKRCILTADFDGEREIAVAVALIQSLVDGRARP
jgi:TetR/AcrR family transcriptional regulator, repressor for uid operon